MSHQPRRAAPAVVRAGVSIVGIAALLSWATGPPADPWRVLVSASNGTVGTADFDQLLGKSAALAAWIGLGWFAIAVFLEGARCLAPGAAGARRSRQGPVRCWFAASCKR